MKMVDRRTNIPNQPPKIAQKKSFNVVSGTLRHTEQHTQCWTLSEHGKVKKYGVLAVNVFVVIKVRLPY